MERFTRTYSTACRDYRSTVCTGRPSRFCTLCADPATRWPSTDTSAVRIQRVAVLNISSRSPLAARTFRSCHSHGSEIIRHSFTILFQL
nr:MAG TPA: hypothetical protein [Caudoviricetes sp.]